MTLTQRTQRTQSRQEREDVWFARERSAGEVDWFVANDFWFGSSFGSVISVISVFQLLFDLEAVWSV